MSDQRLVAVHQVLKLHKPVRRVAKDFGVTRKTLHKWLKRYRDHPHLDLADRSRRPHHQPARTSDQIERVVLEVRDRFAWGPRKIHAFLAQDRSAVEPFADLDPKLLPAVPRHQLPSIRTLANILLRHGRVDESPPKPPIQSFERPAPNDLWQVDFKGPRQVQRQRVCPFSVIDDHSRYCLAFEPCTNTTMARAFELLWQIFGDTGLPAAILADNGFAARGACTPSLGWFDARLIRLGIHPIHGRAYHPQTQGKVEALHRWADPEFLDFDARLDTLEHFTADCRRYRYIRNHLRPHEALADQVPASRWIPSPRKRPDSLPEVQYPAGAQLRKVGQVGEISWHNCRILVGRGVTGQIVQVQESERGIAVYYADYRVRELTHEQLLGGIML